CQTGKPLADIKQVRAFDPQPGNCTGLVFSPDGKTLCVFSKTKDAQGELVVVWDVASGKERKRMTVPLALQQGPIKVAAIAPDNRTLALGLLDGTVRLWDV